MHAVLIVDDEPTLRGLLRRWVESLGFESREAEDAEQALAELDRAPAAIALCDINLPGHGRGHATRVARLALAVADELDLDDDTVTHVERGALLHDIGKLDMPAAILEKPAPVNDGEWQIMRTHPQIGHDLLRNQPRLSDAAEIVLSHHEAFDGSGYPRGLSGDRIPLAARILTVADSYDSMTQPHIQRPAMPAALALSEIERCSGTQFDPACAEALATALVRAAREDAA